MELRKHAFRGRGAQVNPHNPYRANEKVIADLEAVDEPIELDQKTSYIHEFPKKVINEVNSPDLGFSYSINPYQGCEHGCIYCYARNSHTYWGYSAGLDFERKILVKQNLVEQVRKRLNHKNWEVKPVMLSGNTDCYQPAERKFKLTQQVLQLMLDYKHPVSLITKNSLILRDLDILRELAKLKLIHVTISITTLNESLRQKLEPRTVSGIKRLQTVETLVANGIPVNVNVAPVIPGLNSTEIPQLIKAAADAGASSASHIIVRLNGQVAAIFEDWIRQTFPDRADKVLHQIADCHGGQLNDSRFGTRMRGEGRIAESINQLTNIAKKKYLAGRRMPELDHTLFSPSNGRQLDLFT